MERTRHRAGEDGNRVHELLLAREEVRDGRARLLHVVLRLVDGELVADAAVEPRLEDVVRLALQLEVGARHGKALLHGAELHVGARDLGGERDPCVGEAVGGRVKLRLGGLVGAARTAEDVNLPRGVEAAVPVVAVVRLAAAAARAREAVRARTRIGTVHRDARQERGGRPDERPAGLHEALLRHEKGEVVGDRRLDEVRQHAVVELRPPSPDRRSRNLGAWVLIRLRRLEFAGRRLVRRGEAGVRKRHVGGLDLRLLVIRPHGPAPASGHDQRNRAAHGQRQANSLLHVHRSSFRLEFVL